MTASFNTNTRNVTNQKVKEGVILAISFDVWKGQKVSEDEKLMYFCSPDKHSIFRFWKRSEASPTSFEVAARV